MAADDYGPLTPRVKGLGEFTEADLSAIEAGEAPPEAAAFDEVRNC